MLQSVGLQTVGHDLATEKQQQQAACDHGTLGMCLVGRQYAVSVKYTLDF